MSDAVVVEEDDKEDWDLDGAMTAAEAGESSLRGKCCEIQYECRALHTEVPDGFIDAMQMAKIMITFEESTKERWSRAAKEPA